MCVKHLQNEERAVSWATWLKSEFRGHLTHPQPPLFVVSNPRNRPTRRLDPRTSGYLVQPEGSAARARWGANGGSSGAKKKAFFFKVVPRPLGMLKLVFLARFEPVVSRFGPWKIPKCLENGRFWNLKRVKNGTEMRFSKTDPGPLEMLKQVFLAHFEPIGMGFGPWKIPMCLEKEPFWEQKW